MGKKKKDKKNQTAELVKVEEEGLVLDNATALLQAANALDIATHHAVESRDTKTLLAVAQLWIKMSDGLGNQSDLMPPPPQTTMGFQVSDSRAPIQIDEVEE